jgi:hypothetical protein
MVSSLETLLLEFLARYARDCFNGLKHLFVDGTTLALPHGAARKGGLLCRLPALFEPADRSLFAMTERMDTPPPSRGAKRPRDA